MEQKSTPKPDNNEQPKERNEFEFYSTIIFSILGILVVLCFLSSFIYYVYKNKCTSSKANPSHHRNQSVSSAKSKSKSIPVIVNLPSLANSSIVTQTSLIEQSPTNNKANYLTPENIISMGHIQPEVKSQSDSKKLGPLSKSLKISDYRAADMAGKMSSITMTQKT